MKRYTFVANDHYDGAEPYECEDGEFYPVQDVQALAKEVQPYVIGLYNTNPELVEKLKAIIEAK